LSRKGIGKWEKNNSLLAGEYYKNKNGKGKCEPAKSQS